MIGIISDTMSDVPSEVLDRDFLEVVSGKVIIDEKEYRDGVEIKNEDVIDFMEKGGFPKTSLPSYGDIVNSFKTLIKKGYQKIIAINVSSGLSGTYNMFRNVIKDLKKEHENVEVELIDSKSVSVGSGLLVYKAVKMAEQNHEFPDIIESVKNSIENKINIMYTIPTLKYLKAGGRIGKVSATIGDFLNIKPVISVNSDGIYYTVCKERGVRKSVFTMFEKIKTWIENDPIDVIYIGRTDNTPETMELINEIRQKFHALGFEKEKIKTDQINPSLLCHTGKGLIGITVLKS